MNFNSKNSVILEVKTLLNISSFVKDFQFEIIANFSLQQLNFGDYLTAKFLVFILNNENF